MDFSKKKLKIVDFMEFKNKEIQGIDEIVKPRIESAKTQKVTFTFKNNNSVYKEKNNFLRKR